jgi:magnesium-transporting ATPase (P-type)
MEPGAHITVAKFIRAMSWIGLWMEILAIVVFTFVTALAAYRGQSPTPGVLTLVALFISLAVSMYFLGKMEKSRTKM